MKSEDRREEGDEPGTKDEANFALIAYFKAVAS